MKASTSLAAAASSILLLAPLGAFAHEYRVFTIGDKQYNVTVGWLNEPVSVDDKSGIEMIVSELGGGIKQQPMADGLEEDDDGPAGMPVEGLDQTFTVEITAGDQKQTFPLVPEDDRPGGYKAVFYPTAQTTYSFRVLGKINDITLDATYSCVPDGTDGGDNGAPVKISDKVTQNEQAGAFGCPGAKADVEFPKKSAELADLTARLQAVEGRKQGFDFGLVGFVLGLLGFISGAKAWSMVRSRS